MTFSKALITSAIALALLSACGNNDSGVAAGDDGDVAAGGGTTGNGTGGGTGNVNTGNTGNEGNEGNEGAENQQRLRVIDNSDEFYTALREGLIRQAGAGELSTDDVLVTVADSNAGSDTGGADGADESVATSGGADGGATASADLAPPSGRPVDADVATTEQASNEVTGTNVQEIGVDEADRIKTDGEHLFVLDTRYSNVFPVEPGIIEDTAADVADQSSFPIEQGPATTLRILALDASAPDASPVRDLAIDLAGRNPTGMYLHGSGDNQSIILTSSGFGGYWAAWHDPYAFGGVDSVITRVDVSNPSDAQVSDNYHIDGQIISSRRIGNNLFVASRFYPQIPGVVPYSLSQDELRNAVEAADLEALLPRFTRNSDNASQPLVNPAGCFVAEAPRDDYYYSPDIITLAVIDLNTMQLTDSECYLGATETLYASPNAVYLATTQWDYLDLPAVDFDDVAADIAFVDPRVNTDIHQFTINGNGLDYAGSGAVTGHLGWNELRKPFRMSEKDGNLRVATFSDRQAPDVSPINVSVLQPTGQGALRLIAELPNNNRPEHIGKPGEQLYASRFLGDKGYLVTFRQTDPLYVIDFSNPADPFIAGELEIAGYSDYLQPIGEDYLLGIGKDAVPAPDRWGDGRGALAQGVKLSLFNVADPQAPVEVQSVVIGQRGTEATALQNHRAITIQPATDQHPTRVAFGIDVAGRPNPTEAPSGRDATIWYPWNFTGLHGFEVRTGADAGVSSTGVMIVESASNGDFRYGPLAGDDRSVIFNDSVYYIHGPDVYAAPWSDMGNRVGPR